MKDFLNNLADIILLLVYCYHSHKEGIRQSLFHIFIVHSPFIVVVSYVVIDDSYMSRAVEQDLYDTEEKTFYFNEIYGFHRNQNMSRISEGNS